jgi:hypothetical protein
VVVVEQLPAELEVELPTEAPTPLVDVFGLELQVPLAIESKVSHGGSAYPAPATPGAAPAESA